MGFPRKTKGQQVREAALRKRLRQHSKDELRGLSAISLARSYGMSLPDTEAVLKSEIGGVRHG